MIRTAMLKGGTREVVGGLALILGSTAYLFAANQYRLGTPTRMGPGYFPTLLGIAGIVIAASIIARGILMYRSRKLTEDHEGPSLSLRPMLAVAAGIAAFAISIHLVGLFLAITSSIVASAFGDVRSTLKATILLIIVVCAASWLVFVYLLGLPIPILGSIG